jgi:hypothetical protein
MMDYKIVEGFTASKDTRRYVIGRFCGNGVHVAPVDGWFHMRPSFAHVEKSKTAGTAIPSCISPLPLCHKMG